MHSGPEFERIPLQNTGKSRHTVVRLTLLNSLLQAWCSLRLDGASNCCIDRFEIDAARSGKGKALEIDRLKDNESD